MEPHKEHVACYVRVLRKAPVGFMSSFALEPQNDNDILEIRSIPYSHLRCESGTALYGADHHTIAQCYRHLLASRPAGSMGADLDCCGGRAPCTRTFGSRVPKLNSPKKVLSLS